MKRVRLEASARGNRGHDVAVGRGMLSRLHEEMAKLGNFSRYGLVTDDTVRPLVAEPLQAHLGAGGLKPVLFSLPPGEKTKSVETVRDLCCRLLDNGFDRQSLLLAVGGGVVGDITGFAAAIYLRGIDYIQVPTTLLAQVDSSIGGKTGVDLPSGKNLLGAFHQPLLVVIDPDVLVSLPREALQEGLAEAVKAGLVADPKLVDLIEQEGPSLFDGRNPKLEEVILRACRAKCRVVSQDEREAGLRRILNFGHTVGHALEAASGYTVSHGRAVAVGMGVAVRCSERWTGLTGTQATRILAMIERLGLPVGLPKDVDLKAMLAHLEWDKKITGEVCHFVLLAEIGRPVVRAIQLAELRRKLADVLTDMV
jgi:3-dehydroquinate synthase